jgi:aminoglycoside 3-N-acetyltransferase
VHGFDSLTQELRRIGVSPGGVLLVQGSLRAVGPIEGGARTLVAALREVLGPRGTLVAYTATPENSLTSRLDQERTAGMDEEQLRDYRGQMPAFDPRTTPVSPTIGRLAEEIRATPGALRSAHPQTSFAAIGPQARAITEGHALRSHLGEESPTRRLYDLQARGLLIGIPLYLCTAFHLADYRVLQLPSRPYRAVVLDADGRRTWLDFEGLDIDDRHFPQFVPVLKAMLEARHDLPGGRLGEADCHLVPIPDAVDAIAKWLIDNRS